MLDEFLRRNVVEVDALIEKARERLEKAEKHRPDSELVSRMRLGIERLQVYRGFIEKMD
jgi:hypothetical protein